MDKELNEQENQSTEYTHLTERLTASNRHLQEMQNEHDSLMKEMESLRQRATLLTRLDTESYQMSSSTQSAQLNSSSSLSSSTSTSSTAAQITNATASSSGKQIVSVDTEEDEQETADFIREKLTEIAGLKAQLKRVEQMKNTTKLIEEHISSRTSMSSTNREEFFSSVEENSAESSRISSGSGLETENEILRNMTGGNDVEDVRSELLTTMTNMFTDYATDLRGQADSLRAERERIRALKEKILASKRPI